MFDITSFLIRWLFLSNLARDVAEIQTLPHQPYYPPHIATNGLSRARIEECWRDDCVRGILSYPPGAQRLFAIDALRTELANQLAQKLRQSDTILQQGRHQRQSRLDSDSLSRTDEDDPFLDTDVEILKHFEPGRTSVGGQDDTETEDETSDRSSESGESLGKKATLIISRTGTSVMDPEERIPGDDSDLGDSSLEKTGLPSADEIRTSLEGRRDVRNFLPQLVSAVLKSPPAFDPHLENPVQKLRQLLLRRCQEDPSWGIEMCWLLEAEVGRAWKTLFEHRQQTGRRLIVVLPADKAAVLAQIGTERREAFDLLQDAEQATAYGYTFAPQNLQPASKDDEDSEIGLAPRLPSSLSLRRCRHFGDTMHFVDRLTQISLDLRMIPRLQREDYLRESLQEINRRIRRRMITRGDVSLDVEDYRGPFDWPETRDLSSDVLRYSVHFPLVPQTIVWPDGETENGADFNAGEPSPEVVRVLNIVVPESRILASRERCPYLVHMEVADTGLEGSDARLFASGSPHLGSTLEEALGMQRLDSNGRRAIEQNSYKIPNELLDRISVHGGYESAESLRGGWQSDESFSEYDASGGLLYSNPFDFVRQHELEALHHQLHADRNPPPTPPILSERTAFSVGTPLLDRVFGKPWNVRTQEIKDASPFGHVKGWRLASFIMKAGEDIRREALVMQVISKLRSWFSTEIPEESRPFLRPYTIMCVGGDAGLLECLSDVKSVDEVKKRTDNFESLRDYFERAYPASNHHSHLGHSPDIARETPISFATAQENFLRSLVGYSLVCYILQVKDRHNANILLGRDGSIMHIDFGFVLGDTPKMGKVPIFSEKAPFKLSEEFWEVLGGWNISTGGLGVRFCKMFELAFACASAHADEIATLVEGTMLTLHNSAVVARSIANGVRQRLRMRGPPGSVPQKTFIMDLVNAALTSWGTSTYDWLQRNMNGYQ